MLFHPRGTDYSPVVLNDRIRVPLADDNPIGDAVMAAVAPDAERLHPELVKGRPTPVGAYRIGVPVATVPA